MVVKKIGKQLTCIFQVETTNSATLYLVLNIVQRHNAKSQFYSVAEMLSVYFVSKKKIRNHKILENFKKLWLLYTFRYKK